MANYTSWTYALSVDVGYDLPPLPIRYRYENGRLQVAGPGLLAWAQQFCENAVQARIRAWGYRHTRAALALLTRR